MAVSKRKCAGCDLAKPLSQFPTSMAKTCMSCLHDQKTVQQQNEQDLPGPNDLSIAANHEHTGRDEQTGAVPYEPPTFPVEIDPNNPTHQELAARFAASKSLLQFIKRFRPKYMVGWVHKDICRRLERFMKAVEDGKEPRLLLCIPVRHGKSEIASRHFPPWILGHHPDWEVIAASNAQSLATSFSRYQRDLMRDPSYQAVFPGTQLDPTSQSVENWNTTAQGGYLAAGVGTAIIGRGAHVLVIDDPVKDAEAADSAVICDATWEWFISTAMSRLAPGGGVLVIMTWWSENDLAGRLQQLSGMEGADVYEVVKYAAINDIGDEYMLEDDTIEQIPPGSPVPENAVLTRVMNTALHAARYTVDALLRRKATYFALGQQRWWNALYQQNPTPDGGVYFTKEMMVEFTHAPRPGTGVILQAWDFAITEKQKSDWTVGITGVLDEYDTLFIVDVWRFKSDDGIEIGTAIATYAKQWNAVKVGVEDGQIWKSIKSNFEKACTDIKFYPSYEAIVPFTDKATRAQPLRGRMQQKKVQFLGRAPWYAVLKSEFMRFLSGGKHDDIVDAAAHLVRIATSMTAPRPKEQKKQKSWKDNLKAIINGSGGGHMAA